MTGPHSTRAGPALQTLAETDPALAALALWCDHRDGAATRSGGTTITYGPDFADLAPHEQVGLAAHHILHVALRHAPRAADLADRHGADFDADLFNLAADALINSVLEQADYALPRPAVTLSGLAAAGLPRDAALTDWDVERLYLTLLPQQGETGDRADRIRTYARAQGFGGDIDPAPDADQDDTTTQTARWRQHLTRAAEAGRAAGRGIGTALHRLADIPDPATPWHLILRRLLTQTVMMDRRADPRRPSRRWIAAAAQAQQAGTATPGFQPGFAAQTDIARLLVAIDASGSIDDARLALFWAEVTGIARRLRVDLHLAVFDDAIRHTDRIDPSQTRLTLPPMPRDGGTDFAPVVRHATALGVSAVVILTDLDGDPGVAPRFPVFWAVPDGHGVTAPYGRLIDLAR